MINASAFIEHVNKHPIKIIHRSAKNSNPSVFNATITVGKHLENMLCILSALCVKNIEEGNVHALAMAFKKEFRKFVVAEFIKTTTYKQTEFGAGVEAGERLMEAIVLPTFHYYLATLSDGDVVAHIRFFMELMRGIESVDAQNAKDPKTALQEYYQSQKLPLPVYKTQMCGGTQHEPQYESVHVSPNKRIFTATGSSKKTAEQNVAQIALEELNQLKTSDKRNSSNKKHLKTFNSIDTIFDGVLNPVVAGMYKNSELNTAFGLPNDLNSIQLFAPARIKGTDRSLRSHRVYATLGAFYTSFLTTVSSLALVKKNENAPIGMNIGLEVLSEKNFMSFYHSGFISKQSLPYKGHSEYEVTSYYVDCIQACFGAALLNIISNKNKYDYSELMTSSPAVNWIYKRVKNCHSNKFYVSQDILSTHTLHRMQQYGFTIKLDKVLDEFKLTLTHLRNGNIYCVVPFHAYEKRSDAMSHLAGRCLKALDRMEGTFLEEPKTIISKTTQKELISFLLTNIFADRVVKLSNKQLLIIDDTFANYSGQELEVLKEKWRDLDASVIERSVVLFLLHKALGMIDDNIDYHCYLALPIWDGESYLNFDDNNESDNDGDIDTDVGVSEQETGPIAAPPAAPVINKQPVVTVAASPHSAVPAPAVASPISASRTILTLTAPSLVSADPSSTKSHQSTPAGTPSAAPNQHNLAEILARYNNLNIDEIDLLWRDRRTCFKYADEAATVLAKMRYERGLDFKLIFYKNFLETSVITELGLPSFKETIVAITKYPDALAHVKAQPILVQPVKSSLAQSKNKIVSTFKLKQEDERIKKKASITIRAGQSDFRNSLRKAWGKCAITGCETLNVLDAAHIYPYRGEKDNHIKNGLLLRTDIHRLFDSFLLSIDPRTLTIRVSDSIKDAQYRDLDGQRLVDKVGLSSHALEYHWFYFTSQD